MEVPRRPQPTFTITLHERTPAALTGQSDGAAEAPPTAEGTAASAVSVTMEEPPEPKDTSLSSQDSFSEDNLAPEERTGEQPGKKREEEEEEEEAAAERAAQRQLMAVDELVQSERNYLRMLQVSSVTIRSNLQKIQVREAPPPQAQPIGG